MISDYQNHEAHLGQMLLLQLSDDRGQGPGRPGGHVEPDGTFGRNCGSAGDRQICSSVERNVHCLPVNLKNTSRIKLPRLSSYYLHPSKVNLAMPSGSVNLEKRNDSDKTP